jgi:hypothetical protein
MRNRWGIGAIDPNSGEGAADPVGTTINPYFAAFGIDPATAAAKVDPQTGRAPAAPTAPSFLQANSTAIFIGAAALFVMALVTKRGR